jgi:hypothetical protein
LLSSSRLLTDNRSAWNARYRLPIGGAPARLERIYVASDEHGVTPSVRYCDLFGRRHDDGSRVSERVLP